MAEPEKTVLELATELLGREGAEAFDSTGGDRWRSGQPLVADPTTLNLPKPPESPPPVEPETPPKEVAKEEPTSSESAEPKLVLGKYKTEADAEKGLHELIQYAKEGWDKYNSTLQPAKTPAQGAVSPIDELEKLTGIPKEPFEAAIEAKANEVVTKMFAPAIAKIQADQAILKNIPEYEKEFPKLKAFVDANPEVKARVEHAEANGEYQLAAEWAWLQFDHTRKSEKETSLKEQAKEREIKVKDTMADAGVLKPGQTEARTTPVEGEKALTDERYDKLVELAKAGHPSLLWRETIGKTLPKDIFPDN